MKRSDEWSSVMACWIDRSLEHSTQLVDLVVNGRPNGDETGCHTQKEKKTDPDSFGLVSFLLLALVKSTVVSFFPNSIIVANKKLDTNLVDRLGGMHRSLDCKIRKTGLNSQWLVEIAIQNPRSF